LNWTDNPLAETNGALVKHLGADKVREIASKNGLRWGGDYKNRKDEMHFEVAGANGERVRSAPPTAVAAAEPISKPATIAALRDRPPQAVPSIAPTAARPRAPPPAPASTQMAGAPTGPNIFAAALRAMSAPSAAAPVPMMPMVQFRPVRNEVVAGGKQKAFVTLGAADPTLASMG
jgi:D-alanyl-D-alanine carboxypeptidase